MISLTENFDFDNPTAVKIAGMKKINQLLAWDCL